MLEKDYETYIFNSVNAPEVKSELEYLIKTDPYTTEQDYPNLLKLNLDQIDSLLERCWRKGYEIFNNSSIDLEELERLASNYYKEE